MDYLVIIEKGEDGQCSAYVPDLPGCMSSGDSLEEAGRMIGEVIQIHIESMREHEERAPSPISTAGTVSTDAA